MAGGEARADLDVEGVFYRHSLMIPACNPGPNHCGPPTIRMGGLGPMMTQAAGEVADGFIAHPFQSRHSMQTLMIPALEQGLAKSGRELDRFEIICATLVVTADREEEFARVKDAARKQLAFYGSTPAYRPTLEAHGWQDLHLELNRLSKQGRWDAMAELISDEVLETIAVTPA